MGEKKVNEEVLQEECCEKHDCKNKDSHKECEKKELKKQIAELEEQVEKLSQSLKEQTTKANQYLSTASYYKNDAENQKKDFERYKERNKNIEADAIVKAKETTAKKLLPIIDNFDQALAVVDESVMKGFKMIYTSLVDCLTDMGIVEIECKGQLDPEYHNCINTEPTDNEALDGEIATIYQKGYKFVESNKVVRPATVSVYKI